MGRAIPILPIADVDEAKRFYGGVLGFRVVFEAHYPWEPSGETNLGMERGAMRLHLDCPMPGHGRDACACLEVEDADSLYEERHARVEIRRPPENKDWGAQTFDVIDPFGNTLFVVGPVTG
jgi:catechol 2,3-dioxygenase-like lactoylglutathione lyase family enzyme